MILSFRFRFLPFFTAIMMPEKYKSGFLPVTIRFIEIYFWFRRRFQEDEAMVIKNNFYPKSQECLLGQASSGYFSFDSTSLA